MQKWSHLDTGQLLDKLSSLRLLLLLVDDLLQPLALLPRQQLGRLVRRLRPDQLPLGGRKHERIAGVVAARLK